MKIKVIGRSILLKFRATILIYLFILILPISSGEIMAQNSQEAPGGSINNAVETFNSMKQLVGNWQGSFKWTGIKSAQGELKAEYYLTGYGTSLVENLISPDGAVAMSSVYHLDSESLRMTHYCAANNHPRFVASNLGESKDRLDFDFVDITNLKNPGPGHVNGVQLEFVDEDHLNIIFEFTSNKGESIETIWLERIESN